ncbi:DUF4442 domain-containing protein [Winogradskyella psychrotolerans]|uniref:DUF4442 domain-containing protein n=1 Tax=Winogradskyella psychrotolerans TaxID=1344585 RepID=UPI001C07EA3F|nr:DUF4442 domain-containing protein [Winogradskyella psychrotolerans]MBU2929469.1 DUF4442 domain-containing protein [Winogradskyella psychrotolerans]
MNITPSKLNKYLMFKLPAAYFTGVRTKELHENACIVTVKHRWVNQNPFKSMFWAVQGMAAELTTGALVMKKIKSSGEKISMLVASNNASFTKKATGIITFSCSEGGKIDEAILEAIDTGEGQTVWLNAKGVNADGVEVSTFNFEWTLKVKSL